MFYKLSCITLIIITLWLLGLMLFINYIPRYVPNKKSHTEAAIVLTGGSERLQAALDLLQNNMAKKLFVSGVGKGVTLENVLSSTQVAENITNFTDRIELGYSAQDTQGNAQESSLWIEQNNIQSIRLVTAHYHMQRSLLEIQALSPTANILINPVFPSNVKLKYWWKHPGTRNLLVHEYNKYLLAWVRIKLNLEDLILS